MIMELKFFGTASNRCFANQSKEAHNISNSRQFPWNCTACTFLNTPYDSFCQICATPAPTKANQSTWSCSICTFINTSNPLCAMCGTTKKNTTASTESNHMISECDHLKRILYALNYYKVLDLDNNHTNYPLLIQFCDETYKEFLNDYQHVISTHSDHLEQINDELINDQNFGDCVYSECILFDRYHGNDAMQREESLNKDIDDTKVIFYQNLFDAMHNFLFHLFQTGMRVKRNIIQSNDNDDDMKNKEHIDGAFDKITRHIWNKRDKLDLNSNRFSDENNKKFKLNIEKNKQNEINQGIVEKRTLIDVLFDDIKKADIVTAAKQNKLREYLMEEAFDSDAIEEDLMTRKQGSNIINNINDKNSIFSQFMVDYIEELKSMYFIYVQ